MKHITSRDNVVFKELKNLATSAQARRQAGDTVLDGIHLCETYLRNVGMPKTCIVGDSALQHPEVASIVKACMSGSAACIGLSDALFSAITQVEHGLHLVFVISIPDTKRDLKLNRTAVLLDKLQDPGNVGSILRSAAASGIQDIYCSHGCANAWSPKVMRAAMGAHFSLFIAENVDLAALIANGSIPTAATSSHASQTLYGLDVRGPIAWVFGHEGQGVSSEILALTRHQIQIPQSSAVESLNVAASAAICFFEQVRQIGSIPPRLA